MVLWPTAQAPAGLGRLPMVQSPALPSQPAGLDLKDTKSCIGSQAEGEPVHHHRITEPRGQAAAMVTVAEPAGRPQYPSFPPPLVIEPPLFS